MADAMDSACSSEEECCKNFDKKHRDKRKYRSESPYTKRKHRRRSVSPHGRFGPHSPSKNKVHSRDRSRSRGRYRDEGRHYRSKSIEKLDRQRYEERCLTEDKMRHDRVKIEEKGRLEDRAREKLSVLAKLGIELKMPEQEKKKKLWTNDKNPGASTTWQSASFSDGKLTAKFQRLMGIKNSSEEIGQVSKPSTQDQEQLFRRMEKEYEVARQTTHTLRGAGLGFSK